MRILFFAFFMLLSSFASATLPNYKAPEILARANGFDAYRMPPMSFLNSTSPYINNNGDVVFKLMAVAGKNNQSLWINGEIVYSADEGKIMTDPTMNDRGQVIFSVYEELSSDGIFVYDANTKTTQNTVASKNSEIIAHSYAQILNDGEIFFRGTHSDDDRSLYHFTRSLSKIVSEGENTLGFKASYIFGPVVNSQHQTAMKVRLGDKKDWDAKFPDQILLLNQDGSFRVVAEDRKTNPLSPYAGFTNSVALSEKGHVAFIALREDGTQALFVDQAGSQTLIAREGENGIKEIELFAPQINAQGLVAFRAKNAKGLRGLYVSDGQNLRRLIGEGDRIPTDKGFGRIVVDPRCPGFGGNIRLNDQNELVFYAVVDSELGDESWGSGVFKLSPAPTP